MSASWLFRFCQLEVHRCSPDLGLEAALACRQKRMDGTGEENVAASKDHVEVSRSHDVVPISSPVHSEDHQLLCRHWIDLAGINTDSEVPVSTMRN